MSFAFPSSSSTSTHINVITWNCQGGAGINRRKAERLLRWLSSPDPHVICLQEAGNIKELLRHDDILKYVPKNGLLYKEPFAENMRCTTAVICNQITCKALGEDIKHIDLKEIDESFDKGSLHLSSDRVGCAIYFSKCEITFGAIHALSSDKALENLKGAFENYVTHINNANITMIFGCDGNSAHINTSSAFNAINASDRPSTLKGTYVVAADAVHMTQKSGQNIDYFLIKDNAGKLSPLPKAFIDGVDMLEHHIEWGKAEHFALKENLIKAEEIKEWHQRYLSIHMPEVKNYSWDRAGSLSHDHNTAVDTLKTRATKVASYNERLRSGHLDDIRESTKHDVISHFESLSSDGKDLIGDHIPVQMKLALK
ncbi:MAG: endonuclease/exonuclease/phosphatase family protein [Alphaproteobacteria bacterium]|nr:endonuclease/exonuclease/phosphatase family protein [Alphaproteobacteria bacterium]